jgi:hypothetical protein
LHAKAGNTEFKGDDPEAPQAKWAPVPVARKLAVTPHRMWIDQTEFNWSKKEVEAYRAITRSKGSRSRRENRTLAAS